MPKVGLAGFEPATSRLSSVRSNQLSYKPFRSLSPAWGCWGGSENRTAQTGSCGVGVASISHPRSSATRRRTLQPTERVQGGRLSPILSATLSLMKVMAMRLLFSFHTTTLGGVPRVPPVPMPAPEMLVPSGASWTSPLPRINSTSRRVIPGRIWSRLLWVTLLSLQPAMAAARTIKPVTAARVNGRMRASLSGERARRSREYPPF